MNPSISELYPELGLNTDDSFVNFPLLEVGKFDFQELSDTDFAAILYGNGDTDLEPKIPFVDLDPGLTLDIFTDNSFVFNDNFFRNSLVNNDFSLATSTGNGTETDLSPLNSNINPDPPLSLFTYNFGGYEVKKSQIKEELSSRSRSSTESTQVVAKNAKRDLRVDQRFQILDTSQVQLTITHDDTTIACLECSIDYHGYTGTIINTITQLKLLINTMKVEAPMGVPPSLAYLYSNKEYISCVYQRVKYERDISELHGTISNVMYKASSVFGMESPYEPQFYRFELDEEGDRLNESKCGLCAYCEEVRFLPFKNSSYLSHMTLAHGIFSNNYLTPEGTNYGKYHVSKKEKTRSKYKKEVKVREVDAIMCPICAEVIEVGCWSMKSNKLLSYFRHFKNVHGDDTTKPEMAIQHPVVRPRGRTLHILN